MTKLVKIKYKYIVMNNNGRNMWRSNTLHSCGSWDVCHQGMKGIALSYIVIICSWWEIRHDTISTHVGRSDQISASWHAYQSLGQAEYFYSFDFLENADFYCEKIFEKLNKDFQKIREIFSLFGEFFISLYYCLFWCEK